MTSMIRKALLPLLLFVSASAPLFSQFPPPPPGEPPYAYIASPEDLSTFSTGESITFVGDTDYGTSFRWSFGDGPGTATGRIVTKTYSTPGTYSVAFTALSTNGSSTHRISVIIVAPSAKPTIGSFSASPNPITAGGGTTLSWSVAGATSVSIDQNIGTVEPSGSRVLYPTGTTTYTLTASNAQGTTTGQTTVTVYPAPVATSLTAASNPIPAGGSTTLTPVFSGGTGSIDQGIGSVVSGGSYSTGALTAGRTYTLTVTNPIGATATRSLTVGMQPITVSVSPLSSTRGSGSGTIQFTATVSGTTNQAVTWQYTYETWDPAIKDFVQKTGSIPGGLWTIPYLVPQESEIDCTITATSSQDPTKKGYANIRVVRAASISNFTAAVNPVPYGGSTTITPVFSNGSGVIDQGIGAVTSGTAYNTGVLTADKTYTLTVTNEAGTPTTRSLLVSVQAVSVAPGSNFNGGYLTRGVHTSVPVSATVSGAADSTVAWSADGGSFSSATSASGTTVTWYPPAANGVYNVYAKSQADATKSVVRTYTVVDPPVATNLVASTISPVQGGTFTLTPTYSGGTGSIDNGVACPASGVASAPITVNWSGPRTYTLTVTNSAGTTATKQVVVTPQTITVSVSPSSATKTASSGTIQFTATVSGTTNQAVTWSCEYEYEDPVTHETSIKTSPIGSDGLWTIPGPQPPRVAGNPEYWITARSVADSTKFGQATVWVVSAPVATSLTPSTTSPLYGAAVTLTPTFSHGTAAIGSGGAGTSDVKAGAVTGTGYPSAALTSAKTFTLTVTNETGTTATVNSPLVTPQTVEVANITTSSTNRTVNATGITFTSSVSGAVNGAITWTASAGTITAGQGTNTMTWTAPATPQNVTITATSQANGTFKTLAVAVVAAPVATSLAASTISPLYGATVTLTPTFSNGTAVIGSGGAGSSDVKAGAVTGTGYPSAALTSAKTFTLTVTNVAGTAATVTSPLVTPQTVAVANITTSSTNRTVNTTGIIFTSSVSGAANGAITWTASAGTITAGQGTNTMTWTAPPTPQNVTITATSQANGAFKNLIVAVVAAPVATGLTSNPVVVPSGTATAITPVFSGGTGVVDQDIGPVTSNVAFSSGIITSTKTFTLTVTNAAGTTDTKALPITPLAVAINPTTATLGPLATQVLTAIVTGSTNTAVNWTTSGGSLSATTGASVTWTAPSLAGTYTVTAASQLGPAAKATCTITVRPNLTLTPTSISLPRGGSQAFTATLSGTANQGVNWSASGGTLSATTGGTVTWTAPSTPGSYTIWAAWAGDASVKTSATATVVNRNPNVPSLPVPSLRVGQYHASTLPSPSDPDGDALTVQVVGLPPGLSYSATTGQVTGTPTLAGSYAVTMTATDTGGATASSTATWTVAAANATTPLPPPSLPPDETYLPAKARFSEALKYGGSETGLITGVDVARQLQEEVAKMATGKDRATTSSYNYGYDPLGQLVRAEGSFTDPTGVQPVWTDNTYYAYDAHGNRMQAAAVPAGASPRSAWAYTYNAGNNQLKSAGDYTSFTYTVDGAVEQIVKNGKTQTFTYGDPRFMRLPTAIVRYTDDGRKVDTLLRYDMSGTRVSKKDWITQGSQLISLRNTIYLANGTEVLMEVDRKIYSTGAVAPRRFTAYIFGAGSRLARLSWDTDGRPAEEAGVPLIVQNPGFEQHDATLAPTGWDKPESGGSAAVVSDAALGNLLRITRSTASNAYVQQTLGSFAAGDAIRVKVKARGGATGGGSRLAFAGAASASSATVTGATWQDLSLTATLPAAGSLTLQLMAEGTVDQQAFFEDVQVSKLPPALTSTGQPNLWPDPGFEYVLGTGGGVSASAGVTIEPQTTTLREGLHGLRIASGTYNRTIGGLDATKNYLFSIWKNPGTGWVRETRRTLPATGGSLTITLSQAGLYDLAELMVDTGQALPEAWIPENRLGRVDWFITDHLGSTKLLIDQNGQHRFTGDDDPFGINLRSFGDKDAHRYTGQILDEEQGVYYYGARYYLPEIGRFLSGDPAKEYVAHYIYSGNTPINAKDPDGKETLFIHGTWSGPATFGSSMKRYFTGILRDKEGAQFYWSGGNDRNARSNGVDKAFNQILQLHKAGKDINLVAHSHGGNLAFELTQKIAIYNHLTGSDIKVNNLILLNTPVRNDYNPNLTVVNNFVLISNNRDEVQINGGYNGKTSKSASFGVWWKNFNGEPGSEKGAAGRTHPNAINILLPDLAVAEGGVKLNGTMAGAEAHSFMNSASFSWFMKWIQPEIRIAPPSSETAK